MLPSKKGRIVESSISSKSEFLPSASVVAANNDLLTEILLRIPVKSLFQFKSVSRSWNSLIADPLFCCRKNHELYAVTSGLFVNRSPSTATRVHDFIPLVLEGLGTTLNFANKSLAILQSCNGLLCCGSFGVRDGKYKYYICNPTIKQLKTLPDPANRTFTIRGGVKSVCAVNLAFDPRKSLDYKVICVYYSRVQVGYFEIEIYSSNIGLWRCTGDPFHAGVNFNYGVYWNGAIHWFSLWGDGLYFNVDEERIGTLPLPPLSYGTERSIRYFGESHDHLHLVEYHGPRTTKLNVCEMERGYSQWLLKYCIDIEPVMSAFPESVTFYPNTSDIRCYKFGIMTVVQGEDDDKAYLVLSVPGVAVQYNLKDKTFKKIWDFASTSYHRVSPALFGWFDAFPYIESISCT